MTRELFDPLDLELRRMLRDLSEGPPAPRGARVRLRGALALGGPFPPDDPGPRERYPEPWRRIGAANRRRCGTRQNCDASRQSLDAQRCRGRGAHWRVVRARPARKRSFDPSGPDSRKRTPPSGASQNRRLRSHRPRSSLRWLHAAMSEWRRGPRLPRSRRRPRPVRGISSQSRKARSRFFSRRGTATPGCGARGARRRRSVTGLDRFARHARQFPRGTLPRNARR